MRLAVVLALIVAQHCVSSQLAVAEHRSLMSVYDDLGELHIAC